MSKKFKMLFLLVTVFMVTGCVKVDFSMGIHKDKSMDLEIIEAVDKSLFEQDSMGIDTSSFKQAEEQGFLVREYNDDSMQGYVLTKTFDNIDTLSTEETGVISDLSLILEQSDYSLFSIKKGFLKNTYTAKLKVISDDMSSQLGSGVDDDFSIESDSSDDEEFDYGSDYTDDLDYSQMFSNMEMNFVVNLPYKVVNSNATSVDNHGKKLTWNLLIFDDETVDFEFVLYNMTNVYIVIGGVLLVVILLIVTIVNKTGKGKRSSHNTIMSNNVDGQNDHNSILNNGGFVNDFTDSNVSFSSNENNNSFISQNQTDDSVSSSSNDIFFNSPDLEVNAMEQTNVIDSFISSRGTPLNELNQFNTDNNNYVSDTSNLNNEEESTILSNLNSVHYTDAVNSTPDQSVISEQSMQNQVTISNQTSDIDHNSSNSFFQGPDTL